MIKKLGLSIFLVISTFCYADPIGQLLQDVARSFQSAEGCENMLQNNIPSWLSHAIDHHQRNGFFTDEEKRILTLHQTFREANAAHSGALLDLHPLDQKFLENQTPSSMDLFKIPLRDQRHSLFIEATSPIPLRIELNNLKYNIAKLANNLEQQKDKAHAVRELNLLKTKIEILLGSQNNHSNLFSEYFSIKKTFLDIARVLLADRFEKHFGSSANGERLIEPPSQWGSNTILKFPSDIGDLTKKWLIDPQAILDNPMFPSNDPLRTAATLFLFSCLTELPVQFSQLPKYLETNERIVPDSRGSFYTDAWNIYKFHSIRRQIIKTADAYDWPLHLREQMAHNLGYVSWAALLHMEKRFALVPPK